MEHVCGCFGGGGDFAHRLTGVEVAARCLDRRTVLRRDKLCVV